MSSFSFEYPFFLLLIPIYITITLFFKTKQQSYFIPNLVQKLPSIKKKKSFKNMLKYFIIISSIIALASPIQTNYFIDKEKHTLDIVLSIDTSGSMSLNGLNEFDYNQTRLDVVKNVVKSFINERKKDKIACVVFGDRSSIASPLTDDTQALLNIINNITIGVVGKSTALIDSIVQATQLLKNSSSSSKIIILLSDGDDTASRVPLQVALNIIKKYHIKVYAIAIGESNNNLLELIADESGAKSFIVTNAKNLTKVYKNIAKLEATTHNTKKIKVIDYYFNDVLYFTLLSAFMLMFLTKKDGSF